MLQKVTATDDLLEVYQDRDLGSRVIAQLTKGLEIQLGEASVHEGREWIEVTLQNGSAGFVLGPGARGHTTLGQTQHAKRSFPCAASSPTLGGALP